MKAIKLPSVFAFPKKSKYGNTKTCGYDSKKEHSRAMALKQLQNAGVISELREQVVFELAPSVVIQGRKRPPLRYISDFVYVEDGNQIVEDAKGKITEGYRIKRHLMRSVHGIDILET